MLQVRIKPEVSGGALQWWVSPGKWNGPPCGMRLEAEPPERRRALAAIYFSQEKWLYQDRREPLGKRTNPHRWKLVTPGREPCKDKVERLRGRRQREPVGTLGSDIWTENRHSLWGIPVRTPPDCGDPTGAFCYVHTGGSAETRAPATSLNL